MLTPHPPLESHLMLMGAGASGGASFVGPLDAYTSNVIALCCPSRRLLTSWTGNAGRIRVDTTGQPEYDIGFLGTGLCDVAAITSYAGGNNWYWRKIYDQSGNGRHLEQGTASAQPQGAVDGNGLVYGYAPGAGFSTTALETTGLSLAVTDTTDWSVASSAAFLTFVATLRQTSVISERYMLNFGSNFSTSLPGAGTEASLGSTNSGLYTQTFQVGAGGNRLSNRLAQSTGTNASAAFTINAIYFGQGNGGPAWSQNSKFYARGVWSADLGDATADALNTLSQTLFSTQ